MEILVPLLFLLLTFNTPHESRINTLPFTAHTEKDYPYFSYIYTINVKNRVYFKPNASQIIHFPIQPTLALTFKTSDNEVIFPSTPHPFFNTRFNSTLIFSKYTKILLPNLQVVLLLFKILLITLPFLPLDILDTLKFQPLIFNQLTTKLMMSTP